MPPLGFEKLRTLHTALRMFVSVSFGEQEIFDMLVMPKSQIVKTLLRRLKYYKDQDGADVAVESQSQNSAKSESAVDEAVRKTKSKYENKGMRPN